MISGEKKMISKEKKTVSILMQAKEEATRGIR